MTITVLAGDFILADHLNALVPLVAQKSGSTPCTSDTSMNADPHLTLTFAAGTTYDFELDLLITSDSNAAGDFLCELGWTGTATVSAGVAGLINTLASGAAADLEATGAVPDSTTPTASFVVGASTSVTKAVIRGHIVATTASTVTLNWCQFSSNASATNLLIGSTFIARRRS